MSKNKRLNLSDVTLGAVNKRVNNDFEGSSVEDVLGSLVVSKSFETRCRKLYSKTKRHIESKLNPEDIAKVLEESEDGKSLKGEIVAVETLFGTEYLLGDLKWIIRGGKKNAKETLIDAAMVNSTVREALEERGILRKEYVIDYDKIHAIVDPLKSKADIPVDVAVLGEVCELVETERTVRVSTIKENYTEEKEED